jgi:hypothetical protein
MNKILVSIQDDWELLGNGLGNVASHQYLPSLFLMEMADKYGIKPSFMVDVAQGLNYKKYAEKDKNIQIQYNLWQESIQLMRIKGHDVQLHLHPQWLHSKYDGNFFYVDEKYNIGLYNYEDQKYLIEEGINLLKQILSPFDNGYKPSFFKAGGWGIQPSYNVLTLLQENGIKGILGPRKALKRSHQKVDFTQMEEDIYPYSPDFQHIEKIGKESALMVFPLSYVKLPYRLQINMLLENLKTRKSIQYKDEFYDIIDIPTEIITKNHYSLKNRLKENNPFNGNYYTHLKIGGKEKNFAYLKKTFNDVITRYQSHNLHKAPIIIESHTKNYFGRYQDIDRFFDYINKKYGDLVEFVYLSDLLSKYSDQIEIKHS